MMKKIIIIIATVLVVFGVGILVHDKYLLGSATLCFGMLQVTLMMKGSWVAELLAVFETLVGCGIYYLNGLYGSVIFSILVYVPIGIYSVISWKKNQQDGVVKINKFTLKKSVVVVSLILCFVLILSLLLSIIPSQNLSFLDALSNGLNIAGMLLIAFRYKEGWFFWICCNLVEIVTWSIMISNGSENGIMMIIICVVYIILDVFAIRSFMKMRNNQEKRKMEN